MSIRILVAAVRRHVRLFTHVVSSFHLSQPHCGVSVTWKFRCVVYRKVLTVCVLFFIRSVLVVWRFIPC